MSRPDPAPILELIEAFRRSKTMFAAVSLGLFDRLADEPADGATLSRELAIPLDTLERLLDSCVALFLLRRTGGLYRNTEIADAYLRRGSPDSLAGYILYSNEVLFRLWANLEDALREGTPRWKQTFQLDGPIFTSFFRTEEAMRTFLAGMHGFGRLSSPAIVESFDLSGFRRLADLGGATGHLACAACERYPELNAVVFDLPQAIGMAREHVQQSAAASRIELLSGDFFADPLPAADCYALGRILHDWSMEKIDLLLKKIYAALPPGGAILIVEKLLYDDKTGPLGAHMQSLNMLVCAEGRERSAAEYAEILGGIGFHSVEAKRTGTPLDAVFARK
ncbi:MAG: acetylserotonin O-methyltransferase [Bryobacter sp.]|jgi:acetylserotonin N-methyltransferase|nr:acetylserotonin O-methyltransferase [Bryobacter sp.]